LLKSRYTSLAKKGCGMLDRTSLSSRLFELACASAPRLTEFEGDTANVDLREAGLSSIAAVRLMLDVEATFDIAIPDGDLTPENFATVANIERLVTRLKTSAAA
jgi:acyl carrier protein